MNRVLRSTNAPIAERSKPMSRSPSPCPGHGSVVSLGRQLTDHHLGLDMAHIRRREWARGSRNARPVRKRATSSRLSVFAK